VILSPIILPTPALKVRLGCGVRKRRNDYKGFEGMKNRRGLMVCVGSP
jgi:hypothetical protein